jgi:hypothetical protein
VNRETEALADDVRAALIHRIAAHRAALRTAKALGWPAILGPAVAETEARLEEARACLEAVRQATGIGSGA